MSTEQHPIILALDASSTKVGYTIAQGERYITSGVFSPGREATRERDQAVAARIATITRWVLQMIQTHSPDVIAIEEPTGSHRNLRVDRILARVYGAIEAVAVLHKITSLPVHPMKVKKTGFCKTNTEHVARFIGKSKVGPDEADSVGIWQVALSALQAERTMRLGS